MSLIRLLIADDNAEFRQATNRMVSLEDDIQVVSMARDGQEAVELARRHQPDVAIIDVHMPRVDGLTAIRALGNASPSTACMAMSYDGEREILRQAMTAGAREYLIKPFSTDELVTAVRRVAARGQGGPRTGLTAPLPTTGQAPLAEGEDEQARSQMLIKQAVELLRAGRTDGEALRVFAELVQLRNLDTNTLVHLAEVFLARRDWHTLRLLCDRLERQPKGNHDSK
jgi:DNA-binding NarL/FixJ family response regulator